jgi:hypothetical protein
LVKNL